MLKDRLQRARQLGLAALDEPTGKAILREFGIGVPAHQVVRTESEIRAAARALRPPFALKIVSAKAIHKSEVGGVKLGLQTVENAVAAFASMKSAMTGAGMSVDTWLLEEMVPNGVELVVGGLTDPQFGPMVMVGLGGIFVELFKDISIRICPIARLDAEEILHELRGGQLLHGVRGRSGVDITAVIDVILRVGGENGLLMQGAGCVRELDINPLIATSNGAFAADARFILHPEPELKR